MRSIVLVLVLGCGSSEPARCTDPSACPQPGELALQALEPHRGDLLLELGDTTGALAIYQQYYDRVLSARGDRDVALADPIEKLAAARRAQGKLRDALRLHDRAIALRVAAFGPTDPRVARSLIERAKTQLEAGELAAARKELTAAGDPDALRPVEPLTIAPLSPTEPLTVTRTAALSLLVRRLVAAGQLDAARALASDLHARLLPDRNPIIAAEVGAALLAVGDRTAAAAVLGNAAAALGNEPTRTALRVFTLLARASDTNAAAAARAAISLYQAMPALDRAEHDEMWIISRR